MKLNFYKINYYFFYFYIFLIWSLIFLSLTKISREAPTYLNDITYYIRFYICLFLIIKFNPIYNFGISQEFTKLDRAIVYSSALIILTTSQDFILFIKSYFPSLFSK